MEVFINVEARLGFLLLLFQLFLVLLVDIYVFSINKFCKRFSRFNGGNFFLGFNTKLMILEPLATVCPASFFDLRSVPELLE